MKLSVGRPEIGQWYARADQGELFRVVARDEESGTIEIQSFDGDVDEIEAETWSTLPLERSEPPEDWAAPVDDVGRDDLGYSETEMASADGVLPLQPLRMASESEEDTEAEEQERDVLGEGASTDVRERRSS